MSTHEVSTDGSTTIDFDYGDDARATVDMSGWYWGVGAVVSF